MLEPPGLPPDAMEGRRQVVANVSDLRILVERYRIRAHRFSRAHYLAAKQASAMNYRLGVPVVVLSTTVGTTLFSSITASRNTLLVVLAGLLSLVSAVLAALQTLFRFGERADSHRIAGASYAEVKRKLDLLKLQLAVTPDLSTGLRLVIELTEDLSALQKQSPDIPDRLYDRALAEQEVDSEGI